MKKLIVSTSKGDFHIWFVHHRNSKLDDTKKSIARFHKLVPSQCKRKIIATTECVIGTVPGTCPVLNPRKSRPVVGITGCSQGDAFRGVIGVRNSLTRALEAAKGKNPVFLDRTLRQEIWDAVRSQMRTKSR
jgi:hypothetical protein